MPVPLVSLLPDPALPTDPEQVFDNKVGASLLAQQAMVPEINTSVAFVNQRAIDADASAQAAAASEAAAAADRAEVAANTATVASNTATVVARADEVAANTLQVAADADQVAADRVAVDAALASIAGGPVYSVNGMTGNVTGIATQDGAETLTNKTLADPTVTLGGSQGAAGQVPVSQGPGLPPLWGGVTPGCLHVRDQKAAGSKGGTSVAGLQTRVLNTVVTNTIPGASLASNLVTLPAGVYRVSAVAPSITRSHRASLYNVTAAGIAVLGTAAGTPDVSTPISATISLIQGKFTLLAESQVKINHFIEVGITDRGLGDMVSDGNPCVFTDVMILKEA